ncbi:MAG: hypothetical protein DRQ39_00870, partial [Gammaproteobacteria bacterium]
MADAFFTIDGTPGSYLSTPHTPSLELPTPYSMELKVALYDVEGAPASQAIPFLTNRTAVTNGQEFDWWRSGGSNFLRLRYGGNGGQTAPNGLAFSLASGDIHDYSVVVNPTLVSFYIDNVLNRD